MKSKWIFLILLLRAFSSFSATYYVDASRPDDTGTATNWAAAKQTIQAAVDLTVDGDTVWVTNGTYDLTEQIIVTNAITICSVNGREVTIIDGGRSNRCFSLSLACTLRGLTIRNGQASGHGGGIYCTDDLSAVTDCLIISNRAYSGINGTGQSGSDGGGMYRGTPSNCTFIANRAGHGGSGYYGGKYEAGQDGGAGGSGGGFYGIRAYDCKFTDNRAGNGGEGAAAYYFGYDGGVGGYGGGAYGTETVSCTFSNNQAGAGGKGGYGGNGKDGGAGGAGGSGGGLADGSATNCAFFSNQSGAGGDGGLGSGPVGYAGDGGDGGGCYNSSATDCTFRNNQTGNAGDGGGHGRGGNGGGMNAGVAVCCVFSGNGAGKGSDAVADYIEGGNGGSGGGAYRAVASFCVFSNNWAGNGGVGGDGTGSGEPSICGNGGHGGGLSGGSASQCAFFWNQAGNGADSETNTFTLGGIGGNGGGMSGGNATHCTFYGNEAGTGGYGVQTEDLGLENGSGGGKSGGTANNCVAWSNSVANEINDLSGVSANYTCAGNGVVYGANGCITNNPFFVDAGGGDFRLQSNSPCINWGNNSYATNSTDLGGNPRIVEGTVDMGAYEYQGILGLTDSDLDNIPDDWERAHGGNRNPTNTCENGINTVRQAYIAGLDPNDPDSKFTPKLLPGRVLRWNATSGRVYSVYYSTNLLDGFQPLETNIPWTANSFTNASDGPCGYYKIDVRLED